MLIVESPTSSVNPPTESASAETAAETEKIEFKEEAGLKVDSRSKQRFLMSVNSQSNSNVTGLKCSACQMLTSHVGLIVTRYDHSAAITDENKLRHQKRIVGCTNCGKISTK